MSYPALPDRRMPYHRDGTRLALGDAAQGVLVYASGAEAIYANGLNAVASAYVASAPGPYVPPTQKDRAWLFFPEQREITGFYGYFAVGQGLDNPWGYESRGQITTVYGSADTTNGVDGTWETASISGSPAWVNTYSWRDGIKTISLTGAKRAVRFENGVALASNHYLPILHVYGEKGAGQTPDDVIFINHQDTPGVEYSVPQDFGDRPLGTTVTHQFRVKNVSATKTANSVNLQCNDTDFAISEDGTNWVTTINIASLAAGAESATLYVRCTTPAPGALLGPRFAEIVAVVGSWT